MMVKPVTVWQFNISNKIHIYNTGYVCITSLTSTDKCKMLQNIYSMEWYQVMGLTWFAQTKLLKTKCQINHLLTNIGLNQISINPAAKHILSLTIKKLDGCQIQTCKILSYDRKLICLKILDQCWNTIQLCHSSLAGPLQSGYFVSIENTGWPATLFTKSSLGCFWCFDGKETRTGMKRLGRQSKNFSERKQLRKEIPPQGMKNYFLSH